jgi:hypothetical protein
MYIDEEGTLETRDVGRTVKWNQAIESVYIMKSPSLG